MQPNNNHAFKVLNVIYFSLENKVVLWINPKKDESADKSSVKFRWYCQQ